MGSSEAEMRVRAAAWILAAACRDEDPELFFPIGTTGPSLLQVAAAKQVCARCPVRPDCLESALESGQDAGIWGGLTELERRELKHSPGRIGRRG
ncbi:WhiB family transcriptional regulator [Kribbella sp. NPDC056951]|uniref:WhiB family transcriptional regulator n=1 Tax=Kribbella sp. NPDC056951 TaxID=3345978 RepID=UPI00362F2DC8